MSFAKLMELVKDNDEAVTIAKSLETTMSGLTDKVNGLEIKAEDIISSRDKVKAQLRTVKEKLGIDEISDDTLSGILNSKPDEKVQAELNNLKTQLEKANNEKQEVETSYKSKLSNLALKTELNKTGLAQKARNSETYALLENLALQGATYTDEGQVVFKNDDGSTAYIDGKPMGLADKVNSLMGNESYAGLFNPQGKGGSGTPPNSGGGNGLQVKNRAEFETMNPAEQSKFFQDGGRLKD